MISSFDELIKTAKMQDQPQRLLFLFAQVEEKKTKSKKKSKGQITPTMVVDKLPEDLSDFDNLVKEADQISDHWKFMMIAGLSGQNGVAPTTEEADPYLNQMANNVADGNDISSYVIFDRKQNPIMISGG